MEQDIIIIYCTSGPSAIVAINIKITPQSEGTIIGFSDQGHCLTMRGRLHRDNLLYKQQAEGGVKKCLHGDNKVFMNIPFFTLMSLFNVKV